MDQTKLIKRCDELISIGQTVLTTRYEAITGSYVNRGKMMGYRSLCLSFIERLYSQNHPHYKEFDSQTNATDYSAVEVAIAIIESIKNEIIGGWLFSIKDLITAEIFSDFIEMAQYLIQQDYKDAAAVIAGSVLEESLRQLCIKNDIAIEYEKEDSLRPKKSDKLNNELASKSIYSKLDQKLVTAWLDIRNKAAHGKYNEYSRETVMQMIIGITEFTVRNN